MANYIYTPPNSYTQTLRSVLTTDFEPQILSMERVLGNERIVPAYSLVLGICEDQLPLVLDLTDPSPGSVLIAGDDLTSLPMPYDHLKEPSGFTAYSLFS